ncbi:helix-turn-helix transcriptional regulator [Salinicoccus albus]|uniref:helix-turn-helix transcriptional regulator n=1 Tax=Salinicoccus albus TaxID=418756 RepID=UPI000367D581|nr:PAS domain-containing protein [Salinicoccus albus]
MSDTRKILSSYIPLAKTIAEMFGEACEVVIHDLTTPRSSVIFMINNHVTGREAEHSYDHLFKEVLTADSFEGEYLAGYEIITDDHRSIKSSATLIRDAQQQVIGAFCINYDLSVMNQMHEMLNSMIPQHARKEPSETKQGNVQNVEEIADQLITQIVGDKAHLLHNRQEKIRMIQFMDDKGVFLMKGAVEKVAAALGISKVTVYSYLDEVKKHTHEY